VITKTKQSSEVIDLKNLTKPNGIEEKTDLMILGSPRLIIRMQIVTAMDICTVKTTLPLISEIYKRMVVLMFTLEIGQGSKQTKRNREPGYLGWRRFVLFYYS